MAALHEEGFPLCSSGIIATVLNEGGSKLPSKSFACPISYSVGYYILVSVLSRDQARAQVDGPAHFTTGGRPVGASQLKGRLLAALGWRTINVPLAALERLRSVPEGKELYLYRLIHRRDVPLRRPPLPSNLSEARRRHILRLVDKLVGAGVPDPVRTRTGLVWGRGRGRSFLLGWVWAMADREAWRSRPNKGTTPRIRTREGEVRSQGECVVQSRGEGGGSPHAADSARLLVDCNEVGSLLRDDGAKAVQARDSTALPEQGRRSEDHAALGEGSRMSPAVRQAVRKYSRGMLSRKGLVLAVVSKAGSSRSDHVWGERTTRGEEEGLVACTDAEDGRQSNWAPLVDEEEEGLVAYTGTEHGRRSSGAPLVDAGEET